MFPRTSAHAELHMAHSSLRKAFLQTNGKKSMI